ncbi:decaprenyl-phosphate phosphoribosyltransferase, partial [Streptomyces sp. NPDC049099]|uniref:decaprenyl-phosphate phosphoribosyltransferase n=1 Tax=Streptomyces sp. NPDC049099 TaxID=3155768 RepID=UPI00341A324A
MLVFAAPLAAGRFDPWSLRMTAVSFIAFCCAASSIYFLNDILDAPSDRTHPAKRSRPIPAGALSLPVAWTVCPLAAGLALTAAAFTTGAALTAVAAYLALNVAYCVRLKHVAIVDLCLVSASFLLRAMTGGLATGLHLSQWFLLVSGFGALFMVAGKRYSELVALGGDAPRSRRVCAAYTPSYLRFVWIIGAATALLSYNLWAFEVSASAQTGVPWSLLSVIPFTAAVLGYAYHVDRGQAEQ